MRAMTSDRKSEGGYVLLAVIILVGVSLVIIGGALELTANTIRNDSITRDHADFYYNSEHAIGNTVAWMQDNSSFFTSMFLNSSYTGYFDLTAPTIGANENNFFSVPTQIKMKNTQNSVMLSNNDNFGTDAFPATLPNPANNAQTINPVTSFQDAHLGDMNGDGVDDVNVHVVLLNAQASGTNYQPIWRVDAITGNNPDRGVHSYSYVYSRLIDSSTGSGSGASPMIGYYGKNSYSTGNNNTCNSYTYSFNSTTSVWTQSSARSNCRALTDNTFSIGAMIYGNAYTNTTNGIGSGVSRVSGTKCQAPGCHNSQFAAYKTWSAYCPSHQGNLSVSANTTLQLPASIAVTKTAGGNFDPAALPTSPSTQCWQDISVSSNRTITFQNRSTYANTETDPAPAFYIRQLNLNGNANIRFTAPGYDTANSQGKKIRIFVEQLNTNHRVNGNQLVNTTQAAHQLEIHYIGTNAYLFNGTANMRARFIAPFTTVSLNGNMTYYGCIQALGLSAGGSSIMGYDEQCGVTGIVATPSVTDMEFSVRKISHRYR